MQPITAFSAVAVEGVRVWRAPERTRVVLDVSELGEHKMTMLKNPNRLVLDLKDAKLKSELAPVDLKDSPIKKIRFGVRNGNDLRIVLDLASAITANSFSLSANDQYGDRLVVDLFDKGKARSTPIAVSQPSIEDKRDIVVAIDAGHGGEDPGASGSRGVKEKDVVLAIAKKLAALLDQAPGFKAVLVRTGDYFIPLRQRPNEARKQGADLMLSIHADAFRSPKVSGLSVYTLSERGSSSTFAAELAERENSADKIGGAGDAADDVNRVLVDLALTASKEASERAGRQMVKSLKSVGKMHTEVTQTANFAVLRSAVPSMLVETGFISNPKEARLLSKPEYRSKIARAIYKGVRGYFEDLPPEGTLLAWQAAQKQSSSKPSLQSSSQSKPAQKSVAQATHVIKRGETLSGIAQRYRVSMAAIKSLNGLSGSAIRIGQKLKIPG